MNARKHFFLQIVEGITLHIQRSVRIGEEKNKFFQLNLHRIYPSRRIVQTKTIYSLITEIKPKVNESQGENKYMAILQELLSLELNNCPKLIKETRATLEEPEDLPL